MKILHKQTSVINEICCLYLQPWLQINWDSVSNMNKNRMCCFLFWHIFDWKQDKDDIFNVLPHKPCRCLKQVRSNPSSTWLYKKAQKYFAKLLNKCVLHLFMFNTTCQPLWGRSSSSSRRSGFVRTADKSLAFHFDIKFRTYRFRLTSHAACEPNR